MPRHLALREALRRAPYLRKWVVLGALIGIIGGVGAIVFAGALDLATKLLLGGRVPAAESGG